MCYNTATHQRFVFTLDECAWPVTSDEFEADYAVPRGTMDQLVTYANCLNDAYTKVNLVGKSTMSDVWGRHFADSAQLLALGDNRDRWTDLGAGAGFPGLVLAILGADVDLIEATGKKVAFLRSVIERLNLNARARVHHGRIQHIWPWKAATIVARALAPLDVLFDYGLEFASYKTRWVLPKGARAMVEVDAASNRFAFDKYLVPSRTSTEGMIVVASAVKRKIFGAPGGC